MDYSVSPLSPARSHEKQSDLSRERAKIDRRPLIVLAILMAGYASGPDLLMAQDPLLIEESQAWWEIVLQAGAASSTIVVAGFAFIQLWRERQRHLELERAADARISGVGYLLRRKIRAWIGLEPDNGSGLEGWLRAAQNSRSFAKQLDTAEKLLLEMLAISSDASKQVARQIRHVFVFFLAGTSSLNEYATTRRPTGNRKFLKWTQRRDDAEREFRQCLKVLELSVIDEQLLLTEAEIQQGRKAEDPDVRMGKLIEKYLRHGAVTEDDVESYGQSTT